MPTTTSDTTRGATQWIRADRIAVDHRYERALNAVKVRKIVATFDPDAIGVLYVSKRDDGTIVIMDGMHRLNAILQMGWGDQKVPCYVYVGLDLTDEARLFRKFNELRTRPKPLELHRAAVVEGDDRAIGIEKVLADHGLTLGTGPGLNRVVAIEGLQQIFDQAGIDVLDTTISIARQAWGSESSSFAGDVLVGVAVILKRHAAQVDVKRLTSTLHKLEPMQIRQKAAMLKVELGTFGHQRTAGVVANLIVTAYNQRLAEERRIHWDADRTGRYFWTPSRPEVAEAS